MRFHRIVVVTAAVLLACTGVGVVAHADTARPAPRAAAVDDFAIFSPGPDLWLDTANDRVVDVEGWSTAARARVHMWTIQYTSPVTVDNQRWYFNNYEIVNVNSGMCLDKSMDAGDVDGAVVYQYPCTGAPNQLWWVGSDASAGGFTHIKSWEDGRCLDIRDKVDANDASLQVWSCNTSGWNQAWALAAA